MTTRLLASRLVGPRLVAPLFAGGSNTNLIDPPVADARLLFSERNLLNSVAGHLAAQLLGDGYLVYYHATDVLHTPDAWYPNYTTEFTTYAGDTTFAARLAGSKGICTLHDGESAFPRLETRPTNEGEVGSEAEVQVPVMGLSIEPDVALSPYEFGTNRFWRTRALHLDGRARDKGELQALADGLARWFDEQVVFDVADADGLSGEAPDEEHLVTVLRRSVSRMIVPDAGDQDRFQLELTARLEYVA